MRHACLLVWCTSVFGCGEVAKLEVDASVDADPCTGVCECRIDDECGTHQVCDDQGTSRTCGCASGYQKNLGGVCEWSGVVADPGFQAPAMWTLDPDATIDANLNEATMVEPGAARFHINGLCNMARITQTLQMPRRSRAEPLVLQITHRFQSGGIGSTSIAFAVGSTWHDDVPAAFTTFRTDRVCLGAGQYAPESTKGKGAPVPLALMPASLVSGCTNAALFLDVDHVEVMPANPGECPTTGEAINGDAEGTGGWVLTGSSANGNPFSTSIDPNVGEANSKGVRMFARNRCSNLLATNKISVPNAETVPSPALSFYNKTSTAIAGGVATDPLLSRVVLPTINATGTATTQKLCIPAFLRGGVYNFQARVDLYGTCADIVNAESIVDSLKVVNDPSCGTSAALTDPGFESPLGVVGATATPGKSIVRILNSAAEAHAGMGALQIQETAVCDQASWTTNVVVPSASGAAGPALSFFYRADPPNHYAFNAQPAGSFVPTRDSAWHQGSICLDPKLAGRAQAVTFNLQLVTGGACTAIPAENAYVDDLAVTTDPACPAM